MKLYGKAIICLLLCVFMLFPVFGVNAATECPDVSGSNLDSHNYIYYWSDVINSYLADTKDGLIRVQNGAVDGQYLVEYYNSDYSIKKQLLIKEELSVFGGFYATESNYFILSGQTNPDELASVECFRITKYDLNWNRLSSVGLFDCNTYIPFDAGNARFAHCGDYLLIRTSHEMYLSDDGKHHQANVTIQVDVKNMKITDSYTDVMNPSVGYVSHSFNQFIKIENNKIVALDHGDAVPRSVVITKYPTDVTEGSFFSWDCENIHVLTIPGKRGLNQTGVEVGGFEISANNYITAYSAVELDDNFLSYSTYNVHLAITDKATGVTTIKKLTDFNEGESGASVPQFVKINDNKFMILWDRGTDVYYKMIDGNGNDLSALNSFKNADLSDCAPIVFNGNVVWYTYTNEETAVYSININTPSQQNIYEVYSGHQIKISSYPDAPGGECTTVCEKCGKTETFSTPSEIRVYWNGDGGVGTFNYPIPETEFEVNDTLYYLCNQSAEDSPEYEMVIDISDKENVSFERIDDGYGYFTFLAPGEYTIKISYKYNPSVYHSVTVTVSGGFTTDAGPDGLGDVNESGAIDMMDYILLKRNYFGTFKFNEEQLKRGDVNRSGAIDMMDYILLKRAYFGTFTLQ